jgi:signal peptidase II
MIKKNIIYFFIILVIFLADRISKLWIIKISNINKYPDLALLPFVNFNLIWNKGIAFGLFSFNQKSNYDLLTGLIILVTLIVFWMTIKTRGFEKYGFLVIFSGSLGNIFDRVMYSSVPDFIDIHYKNFHWFIFNVADIFITLGVVILIINELILKNQK